MSGSNQNIVVDAGGNAAPQAFDANANSYFYLGGDSIRTEAFYRQAPIVPFNLGAYTTGGLVKSGAGGTFFGAYGQYNGSANAWIMVFDANGAPSTGTKPLASTAVGPITPSGPDVNWFIAPGKPYTFTTGLYIALSTTGGTFTSSGSSNLTGTVEFI